MKVTVCLNPVHSALGPYGCVLGYTLFSDQMKDPASLKFAEAVGAEGMEVVPDPKILSPKEFLDECLYERFPNPYLGVYCGAASARGEGKLADTLKVFKLEFEQFHGKLAPSFL